MKNNQNIVKLIENNFSNKKSLEENLKFSFSELKLKKQNIPLVIAKNYAADLYETSKNEEVNFNSFVNVFYLVLEKDDFLALLLLMSNAFPNFKNFKDKHIVYEKRLGLYNSELKYNTSHNNIIKDTKDILTKYIQLLGLAIGIVMFYFMVIKQIPHIPLIFSNIMTIGLFAFVGKPMMQVWHSSNSIKNKILQYSVVIFFFLSIGSLIGSLPVYAFGNTKDLVILYLSLSGPLFLAFVIGLNSFISIYKK